MNGAGEFMAAERRTRAGAAGVADADDGST